jgi:prepilin-type N-terminal cleavage/methylation domain-containing protein
MKNYFNTGFTLVELMVVVTIIAILSSILFASFGDARAQSRDKARMTALKELQLSIELYKAQNGTYPTQGCGSGTQFAGPGSATDSSFSSCVTYITGLVPDFISVLPADTLYENEANRGFYYRSDGNSYKLMAYDVVETLTVTLGDEFARCPSTSGACASGIPANTYAVYSAGAESW